MRVESHSVEKKQEIILKLLQFGTVMVFLDSSVRGVLVPDHLKNDVQLKLNFDYSYELEDMRILPDRLEATLSFNQSNFFCVIPMDAVYFMLCPALQYGVLYDGSVPKEMLDFFHQHSTYHQNRSLSHSDCRVNLDRLPNTEDFSETSSEDIIQRNHLRLVKS